MFMFSAPLPHHRTTFVRLSTEAGFNVTVTPNHYLFSLRHSEASAASLKSLYAWRYTLPTEVRTASCFAWPCMAALCACTNAASTMPPFLPAPQIRVGDVVPVVHDAAPGARFRPSRVTQVELVRRLGAVACAVHG